MKQRPGAEILVIVLLFVAACVFGSMGRSQKEELPVLRAAPADTSPLGGAGLRLTLTRLGYTVKTQTNGLASMPGDARVWLLLDPSTTFSQKESDALLKWVHDGGLLVWVLGDLDQIGATVGIVPAGIGIGESAGVAKLRRTLGVDLITVRGSSYNDDPLPALTPLTQGAISVYWSGVKKLSGSTGLIDIRGDHLEIAGDKLGEQLGRIDYGKGHVIVAPDALLFTNYALSTPDNAVFATNLIRYHVPDSGAAVYFDARRTSDEEETPASTEERGLLFYLWRPPIRYAVLQLLCATLLAWMLYGRRLGAPVPLPEEEPVTRASRFAMAMGGLFYKARRPEAAAAIIGEDFRRQLTRLLGLSPGDSDDAIAARAATVADLPSQMVLRLLQAARNPSSEEDEALSLAQEMENLLRAIEQGSRVRAGRVITAGPRDERSR